ASADSWLSAASRAGEPGVLPGAQSDIVGECAGAPDSTVAVCVRPGGDGDVPGAGPVGGASGAVGASAGRSERRGRSRPATSAVFASDGAGVAAALADDAAAVASKHARYGM